MQEIWTKTVLVQIFFWTFAIGCQEKFIIEFT